MNFDENILKAAHKHCIFNKTEILQSKLCGCFYCLTTFIPADVIEWVDKDNPKGMTSICPNCRIDSVIGDESGYPVADQDFLKAMNCFFF